MYRRDFLDSACSAGRLLGPWLDLPTPLAQSTPQVSLLRFSRRAMATTFEILFSFDQRGATDLAEAAFELIDELEAQLTVYGDDSEVSRLNARAASEPIAVEARLFQLLVEADRLTRESGGAFDVTAGPLIKAWGFFRRQGRVPTPTERQATLDRVGMRHVELKPEAKTVHFRKPGMEINLGSIGKGYALDRCAELLRSHGLVNALLHAGGSSVLAIGSQPGTSGWPVGIRHPWDESRRLGVVHLRDRAIGTSAATFQHFEYNKRKLGHLLDPRTGRPAEGIASASAVAGSAAEADALATAFFVLGLEKARLFCQTHSGVGAVLLPEGDGAIATAIGLTPDDLVTVN
jgi:thiamine biosynthesis lipoprotein